MKPFVMGAPVGGEVPARVVVADAQIAVEILAVVGGEDGSTVFTKVVEDEHPKRGDYACFPLADVRFDDAMDAP